MEYVYAAMLLHSAGKEINEENVEKVLTAAGVEVDKARVKALTVALEGVNIDEAISKAVSFAVPAVQAPAAVAQTPASEGGEGEKEEEKKEEEEEEEVSEEEAAAGLGALFG